MSARDRLVSGQAWDDFCDSLKQIGHTIDAFGDEPDDLDRAEWYRVLTRCMRSFFVKYMENSEANRPRVLPSTPWRPRLFFSCPDQDHYVVEFPEPGHSYRLFGTRGNGSHFTIATWDSLRPPVPGDRDWAPLGLDGLKDCDPYHTQSTGLLSEDMIDFDEDGRFEVILSPEPVNDTGRNWLRLKPNSWSLMIRMIHYHAEGSVSPDVQVERLDRPTPRPTTAGEMASGLALTAQYLRAFAEDTRFCWQEKWAGRRNEIVFDQAAYLAFGGIADRQIGFGPWECAADEALVFRLTPPDCAYWNFHISNMWHELLDTIEDGGSTIQKYTAAYEPDGSVVIVLADRDPGIGGNWISTWGHRRGTMCMRYLMTRDAPPPMTCEVIKLPPAAG